MSDKKHYFLKLNPPRASFTVDMTPEERAIMQKHVAYWAPYVQDGTVIVLGPVFDPKGGWGMAVIGVESEDQLNALLANDPANGLNSYEVFPMRANYRQPLTS
ncbi:MAG: YciI family protein [Bacteroidota bacterium]|nr:YciI family protein [Bacteroidota bacterium]MDP4232081.1 YciI family protein [Bacteroidota bacterium]MDP4241212.1 YciI family protein [Bacteroidota bacterium]MDP4286604.1 YciI family protein [Bacteroidota bacterium]